MLRWIAPSRILTFVVICCKNFDYRSPAGHARQDSYHRSLEKVPEYL
jgi:hypothetical protein